MDLYAYVRPVDDNNHAPHVSRGLLSLANCVWMVRERAREGDWLVGLTSVKANPDRKRRISYIARVDEKVTRQEYWKRFSRIAAVDSRSKTARQDNYYEPRTCAPFYSQNVNPYHDLDDVWKDLRSQYVLLSRTFRDFGPNTQTRIPVHWAMIEHSLEPPRQRGYRKFPVRVVHLNTLTLE